MKHIFKRNQLIITSLAALIAVAGYLNYTEKNDKARKDKMEAAAKIEAVATGNEENSSSTKLSDITVVCSYMRKWKFGYRNRRWQKDHWNS